MITIFSQPFFHGRNRDAKPMDLLEEIMQIPQLLAWGEAPGFFVMKKTAQKHGYKSVPDSIAGLSESGGSAKP